ncbi:COLEC11 [Branchiostoma lanceolatum]|uniref:COLEC11 protein n=1 Tax=Branchiostoma lanceolatum TaxID=7740 RepID=A0A8J9W4U8_BRALA|nr:COLEC11 [Branchiostoma lanceolatum]
MGVNVVIVAVAVVMMTSQASGQPTWECSAPRTEEKCVCSPVIHVHNYGDKQEENDETANSQDARVTELQDQVRNLTAELALLKQAFHEKHSCPSGYVQFEDRCFSFSTDIKNYTEAMSACQAAGGHLALPKDQATNVFLVNQLTRYPASASSAWFGLTDQVREGTFVWEDGTPLTGWSNWSPGQPDDSGSAEDCAEWEAVYGYKWNDEPCSRSQYYVCEL